MGVKYSCFISYRHLPGNERHFGELFDLLKYEIALWMNQPVFHDVEQFKDRKFSDQELATALCESACMISVYIPVYVGEGRYCFREYLGMEQLETRRFKLLGGGSPKTGFIIPIVCRDWENVPKAIKEERPCYNFENILLRGRKLSRDPEARKYFKEIAQYINARCEELEAAKIHAFKPCPNFKIPTEADVLEWLRKIRQSNRSEQRFPR
jgi:hypothetical protein